ncbi:MAG: cation transporter [Ignavibacteriae bacterium]|nr:cation transporter [Ignavibacteriota bacterium]
METSIPLSVEADQRRLYSIAFALSIFTIVYNIGEGLVSTYFGYEDETLALFGFGVDSFIEALSGFGIAHMIIRIRQNQNTVRDDFERTALKVTGYSFYLLVAGLLISAIINIITNHQPETTFWGIVISIVSIAVMYALMYGKLHVGRRLNSQPIIADAGCTRVCIYMSLVLLASSGVYELFHVPHVDTVATFGLAYFSFKEGKECFEKAANENACCDDCSPHS